MTGTGGTGELGADLLVALTELRDRLLDVRLPLPVAGAEEAAGAAAAAAHQLDDYVLPRLREIDAPLLAVVGGSTGAGKSTLVNALVGRPVTRTGVLRPTTRAPVLVHHPADRRWFEGPRVLPGLPRVTGPAGEPADPGTLRLVAEPAVPAGLALLDAPDVDSVVAENRELAVQLLAAADLWLFVTTAARYADAVPWALLRRAADRRASVAVVLDRVPSEAAGEVSAHLAQMLAGQGLGDAPVFVVPEVALDRLSEGDRQLPAAHAAEVSRWLSALAADAAARAAVVRRTLDGAVEDLVRRVPQVGAAADAQAQAAETLRSAAHHAYSGAVEEVDVATRDGSVLRGEVLARWQDFVGTGEFFRSLEQHVGRIRDRVEAALRGRPAPAAGVEVAIEHGLQALLLDAADHAAEQASAAWRADPAGRALLDEDLERRSPQLAERAAAQVRGWQGGVLDLVRSEGQGKRTTARVLSFGVNGLGLALMVVVFASTGGLTGAEVGIAGGTAVVGQRLLEAVFGEQAVRRLADRARADLRERCARLFAEEGERFTGRVDALGLDPAAGRVLRDVAARVAAARLPPGHGIPTGAPRGGAAR